MLVNVHVMVIQTSTPFTAAFLLKHIQEHMADMLSFLSGLISLILVLVFDLEDL